jgi:hypothetical protein
MDEMGSNLRFIDQFIRFSFIDIKFWKTRKDLEGLSIRTIFLNLFFQVVIFLYLIDNETSRVILFSTAAGLLIEAWKIKKALIITVRI